MTSSASGAKSRRREPLWAMKGKRVERPVLRSCPEGGAKRAPHAELGRRRIRPLRGALRVRAAAFRVEVGVEAAGDGGQTVAAGAQRGGERRGARDVLARHPSDRGG